MKNVLMIILMVCVAVRAAGPWAADRPERRERLKQPIGADPPATGPDALFRKKLQSAIQFDIDRAFGRRPRTETFGGTLGSWDDPRTHRIQWTRRGDGEGRGRHHRSKWGFWRDPLLGLGGRHLWIGPSGWFYSGKHGSVIIQIGSGYWFGSPGFGWHRAYHERGLWTIRPSRDRRVIVYRDDYPLTYFYPLPPSYYGFSTTPLRPPVDYESGYQLPSRPGTVAPVDAWKMFVPPKEEQEKQGEEKRLKVPPEAKQYGLDTLVPDTEKGEGERQALAAGKALLREGRYGDAAAYFSLARHLAPADVESARLLITSLVATRQYDAALEQVRTVLAGSDLTASAARAFTADTRRLYGEGASLGKDVARLEGYVAGRGREGQYAVLVGYMRAVSGDLEGARRALSGAEGDVAGALRGYLGD
jgi:hypothetical protein